MAKKPIKQARALQDLPHIGASAGDLIAAPAAELDELVQRGQADDHPSAVEYAVSINARTVDVEALRTAQLAEAEAEAATPAPSAAA